MLKVFRKFRQKLLTQSRATKYLAYAVGEIVLVVIGILIALQINNLNEERKTNAKEESILATIHTEFLANKIQFNTVVAFHQNAYTASTKLVEMFPIDLNTANLDTISSYLWDATYFYTFNPSESSITSITSTSSFDIIKNDSLREILIGWKDMVGDFREDEKSGVEFYNSMLGPFLSKNLDYEFNLKDSRNNLKVLESLEFEYLMKTRYWLLKEMFLENAEIARIKRHIDEIIKLTSNNSY
jgi:hypothetical protein